MSQSRSDTKNPAYISRLASQGQENAAADGGELRRTGAPTFAFEKSALATRGRWAHFICTFDAFTLQQGPGYIELIVGTRSIRRLDLGWALAATHSSIFFVPDETTNILYTPLSGATRVELKRFQFVPVGKLKLLLLLLARAYRAHRISGGNLASLTLELSSYRQRAGTSLRSYLVDMYGLRPTLPGGRLALLDSALRRDLEKSVAHRADVTTFVPLSEDSLTGTTLAVRAIAFYLPQFHPIAENDQWWGRGFTEWTNVTKALPRFKGHYQPRLAGELGYYDLRIPAVMRRQVELAQMHGIHAFCFYYYWFNGKRLLESPLQMFIDDRLGNFSFCVCWANENWTRTWDGADHEILAEQIYSPSDDLEFIEHLKPILVDRRYLRIENKPLILVYRPSNLPAPKETFARWRDACRENGVGEIHIAGVLSFANYQPEDFGLDAAVEFPPHLFDRSDVTDQQQFYSADQVGVVYDFESLVAAAKHPKPSGTRRYRAVMPGWDNEARRPGRGMTFIKSSPAAYTEWLQAVCEQAMEQPTEDRLIFINAWNEWGEGAYLEPDRKFGYAYLHATKNILRQFAQASPDLANIMAASQSQFKKSSDFAVIVHLFYESLWEEISGYLAQVKATDVFISVSSIISSKTLAAITKGLPNAYIISIENRGRDIYPFVVLLNVVHDFGYQAICKLHTKLSPFRADGDALRATAYERLLGSPQRPEQVLSVFKERKVGILAPQAALASVANPQYMAANGIQVRRFATRMGASLDFTNQLFPAGSMYWFVPAALEPLRRLRLSATDFPAELGQVDGTAAHAIERIVGISAATAGYAIEAIETVIYTRSVSI